MNFLPQIPADETLFISAEGFNHLLKNIDPKVPNKNYLWTTDYRTQLPIRVKKQGYGSQKPYTFSQLWKETLINYSKNIALNYQGLNNKWFSMTYQEYYNESIKFGKGLISLGITFYTAINIIGFNSVEWAITFSGSILAHYLPIGIYTTNGADTCSYIANHSQCEVVVMQNRQHLQKYIQIRAQTPLIKYYILYKDTVPNNLPADMKSRVITWQRFMQIADSQYNPKNKQDTIEERMEIQKPGNCCTFIYTSGTTGPPKAVMISHDNYTWITDAVGKMLGFSEKIGKGRILSLLPLSHVAAQLVDLVVCLKFGFSLFFTDPTALQGNLLKFLLIARPTFFVSVPRVWQKIQEKLNLIGSQTTGLKRKIADWAKNVGPQGTYAEKNNTTKPSMWSIRKKLVFDKIKQNLGLDQCELFIFAAAPMKQSTRLFFMNLNIFLHNCYGMSQLSGPETFTYPSYWKNFNSQQFLRESGKPINGLQLFIDNPDFEGNGEICLRGRNVFMGYFKNQNQTRKAMDSLGFLHSGDIGKLDKNGNLSITGRIKELIITAGGQNIPPVLIENSINTVLPIFSYVVVIGEKKPYLTALLCLKSNENSILADETINYISQKGSNAKTIKQAIQCKKLHQIIHEGIEKVNEKAISNAQTIKKFTILPVQFSVNSNTLTPTLKLKRKIISQKYIAQIEQMYLISKL